MDEELEYRNNHQPLAEKMRPRSLEEVVGQRELIGEGKILTEIINSGKPVNVIFWGPAGTGKTTLARIMAKEFKADFNELSAVTASKKDISTIIEKARVNWNLKVRTILFVDEIHRFNKAQQDAFLPHVESGLITLIGATTENPSFEVINPLLSRARVLVLTKLEESDIIEILERALDRFLPKLKVEEGVLAFLAKTAGGDARFALGTLELTAAISPKKISLNDIVQAIGKKQANYDKNGQWHYNLISAFIKSMRASDANASLYYLARMLQAGEDAKFIARRMMIFASEDIGLASNGVLNLATSAFLAVERVGMPESGIILAHVVSVMAMAKKSRKSYDAWRRAEIAAKMIPSAMPPLEICNNSTQLMTELGYAKGYKWETGFKLGKSYFPEELGEQDFFN